MLPSTAALSDSSDTNGATAGAGVSPVAVSSAASSSSSKFWAFALFPRLKRLQAMDTHTNEVKFNSSFNNIQSSALEQLTSSY